MLFVQLLEDLGERGESGKERDRESERERDPEFIPSIHHRAKFLVDVGGWEGEGANEEVSSVLRRQRDPGKPDLLTA